MSPESDFWKIWDLFFYFPRRWVRECSVYWIPDPIAHLSMTLSKQNFEILIFFGGFWPYFMKIACFLKMMWFLKIWDLFFSFSETMSERMLSALNSWVHCPLVYNIVEAKFWNSHFSMDFDHISWKHHWFFELEFRNNVSFHEIWSKSIEKWEFQNFASTML